MTAKPIPCDRIDHFLHEKPKPAKLLDVVLLEIQANGPVSPRLLASKLSKSVARIKQMLHILAWQGLIEMTIPDKPTSRNQQWRAK